MESRTEWTDARLNDLVERPDRTLERLDQGVSELRSEMCALYSELRSEFSAPRRDLRIAAVVLMATIVGTGILT
jgi:hypothetical protein